MPAPNVVLLHCDQLRYDGLGCNRNSFAATPNLDALATEATRFTRHIVANPICTPSRAALMTGLYPPGNNVWCNGVALPRAEHTHCVQPPNQPPLVAYPQTMPDHFAAAGYDTLMLGKLHLTPNIAPPEYGYPETYVNWNDGALDGWHGPYYGFRHVEMTKGHGEQPCHRGHYSVWLKHEHPEVYAAVVDAANRHYPCPGMNDLYPSAVPAELHNSMWLADRLDAYLAQRDDQPFFAFVGFPDPHHPFTPPAELARQFAEWEVKPPADPDAAGVAGSPLLRFSQHQPHEKTPQELLMAARQTYAMVHLIDRAVGRIITALRSRGLWENTILAFTSDHGDFLGDHGMLYKGFSGSDALLHTPLLLHAPGAGLPPQIDQPVSNVDLLPTLAGLAGVPVPEGLHGCDVRQVLGSEHYALAYSSNGYPESLNLTIYDREVRLTWYPRLDHIDLYDHTNDPGECRNVADEAKYAARVKELVGVLRESLAQHYSPVLGRVGLW